MEKGHYGEYSGNAKHSRVTASNYKASERDDAAHIDYLKRDVLYDDHHSHSDAAMTADEKHISKLAGDMKYDKKHHGMSRESADLKYMPIEDDMKRGMSRESSPQELTPQEQFDKAEAALNAFNDSRDGRRIQKLSEMDANVNTMERVKERDSLMGIQKPFEDVYDASLAKLLASRKNGPSRESSELKYMPIEDDMKRGMSRKGSKPDYIDIDGDGNKTESMKEASDGMSRKSKSERLRERAVKKSERSGEGQGGYDYENPRVMSMLNKAKTLDERSGLPMNTNMTRHIGKKKDIEKAAKQGMEMGRFLDNEYDNQKRDEEMNRMMDERGGMSRMSDWGGNKRDYHRHMDAQGHMTRDGVVGGGKYGKGGHYKDYEGMSRDSYGMERKSCGTKYTGLGRYSSPAAFMGIKRPGRCTPFPNPDCEPGTPQYNLAKRLKPGGDLYKGKKK